jgi:hypothetical protein
MFGRRGNPSSAHRSQPSVAGRPQPFTSALGRIRKTGIPESFDDTVNSRIGGGF